MEDLDDWLLEAAGRTASGAAKQAHHPSKRRHRDSFSDDESDSKDDSDDINKYPSRKPSGSHVPLKKRSKKSDGHQESSDEEVDPTLHPDSDDSDVGSDLYKDEYDREQLAQLTELERELILSDRASKKDDKKLQKQMKSRWKTDKKPEHGSRASPPSSTRSVRTSARTADKTAAKVDALNELRARRMKRDPDARNRSGDPSSAARQSRDFSPIKRRGLGISSPRSTSRSESGSESHSEDEGSVGDGRMDDSDDERFKPESETVTFEDIKSITIRRSKLAKWHMEPFFEELIVGCCVRVGIGVRSGQNIYRLCIVHNVDSSDPNKAYQLESRTTHKYLNCVWGSEKSAARWQMARISDSHPTQEEFEQWVREVERNSGWMPTKKEVREKKEAIEKANSFVYSAETVKQMLEIKKASSRPLNIAAEREKLKTEMERAKENDDEAEVERIKARIQELEELRRRSEKKNEKALKLQEMNRKNRAENFNTASGLKRVNQDLKAGEAGYDPFSRRWTRSRNYYSGKPGAGAEAEVAPEAEPSTTQVGSEVPQTGTKGSAESGVAATEAALKEAAGAGKLTDTSAPVDLGTESNTLHGFELPISLAPLQRFGGPHGAGPAFMERKQRMEAKIGCQIPEDDERKHLLTLTVGDYKRRRGLL